MRAHDEDDVVRLDELARELLRAMAREVEAALERDEQRAVGSRCAFPGARAGTGDLDVTQAALDRLPAREHLRQCAPAGIPGTDKEQSHHSSGVANQVGHTLAQNLGGDRTGSYYARKPARAVYHRGRRRGFQTTAVQNPKD